jgi:hypothetical protein
LSSAQDPTVFIGSSGEGLEVAENLQSVLDDHCEATVWNQGPFGLSETGIASLLQAAASYDFAVLVLTPDDLTIRRNAAASSARDNVLFEAGLFVGALGLQRTFLVSCRQDDLRLPTDLDGVTRATYRIRRDGSLRAALNPVGLEIRRAMKELGLRRAGSQPATAPPSVDKQMLSLEEEAVLLDQELSSLTTSAAAQGWTLKTRTSSAYRLVSPDGVRFSLALVDPRRARQDLRPYARELNEYGLRLSRALLTPVDDTISPSSRTGERGSSRSRKRKA